jgi:hypothetical protein
MPEIRPEKVLSGRVPAVLKAASGDSMVAGSKKRLGRSLGGRKTLGERKSSTSVGECQRWRQEVSVGVDTAPPDL